MFVKLDRENEWDEDLLHWCRLCGPKRRNHVVRRISPPLSEAASYPREDVVKCERCGLEWKAERETDLIAVPYVYEKKPTYEHCIPLPYTPTDVRRPRFGRLCAECVPYTAIDNMQSSSRMVPHVVPISVSAVPYTKTDEEYLAQKKIYPRKPLLTESGYHSTLDRRNAIKDNEYMISDTPKKKSKCTIF